MEPKHKVLLQKHYQNLVESVTDVDRVLDSLAHRGTLTQSERYELVQKFCSGPEKVDLLLQTLLSKDRDHFAELCAALQETHPHLRPMLLGDTGAPDHTGGKTTTTTTTNNKQQQTRRGGVRWRAALQSMI